MHNTTNPQLDYRKNDDKCTDGNNNNLIAFDKWTRRKIKSRQFY